MDVESAGTHPAGVFASNAKKFLEKENALKNLKRAPEGIDQKNLEECNLIVAMKQNHKNELLRRYPQIEDKIQVWTSTIPSIFPTDLTRKFLRK